MRSADQTMGAARVRRRSRGIMVSSGLSAAIVAFGCGGGPGVDLPAERPASTPLEPGDYSGTANCTASVASVEETINAEPSSITVLATIDAAGFPTQNGEAVDIGDVRTLEFFSGTLRGIVSAISVDGNSLAVVRNLSGTLSDGVELLGSTVETYRRLGNGGLDYTVTTTVTAGTDFTLRQSCDGTLDRS